MARTEVHHIKPRFIGGDNSPENLVRVTLPQHAEAHFDASRAARAEGNRGVAFKHALSFDMVVSRMTTQEMMEMTIKLMDKPTRRG